jgi:hypothetical protein
MTIPTNFELANNSEFRLLTNFATPPRAGRVTTLEASGQVRVETDDPDGGDVLAWPLNGFTYAVNDVVYVAFAVNNPDSAIVIGSKSPVPTLDVAALPEAYVPVDGTDPLTGDWDIGEDRRIKAEALRARDAEGLKLEDDEGNIGLHVADGGNVSIGTDSPGTEAAPLYVEKDGSFCPVNVACWRTSTSGSRALFTGKAASGSKASPGVLGSGQYIFSVVGQGWDGSAFQNAGRLDVRADGAHNASSVPGRWEFATTPSGSITPLTAMLIDSSQRVAIGPAVAQGKLHAHDGTGGMIFVSKTGISTTAVTIIANGTGDVTGGIAGFFVVNDGSGAVANTLTLLSGDHLDVVAGGFTLRLALNVNGALTAVRQAGPGTATLVLLGVWM